MSDDVAQQVALRSFDTVPECPFDQLSNREMQITLMVVGCRKVQQISRDLHLSPKTVNSYRYRIFEKLNVTSDVELALLAVRHGVIEGNRASPAPQACEPVDAEAERMLA
jgi:DNA-binding NarL/FixJ family response regulator